MVDEQDAADAPRKARSGNVPPIVGIGASAGGLDAFKSFLRRMPADSGVALVIVQHLDPANPTLLCELLAKLTPMPVVPVREPVAARPDHVYVAEPNSVLSIEDGLLTPTSSPSEKRRRGCIDEFLRSLAADRGDRAIGILLSGAGSDGTLGLKAIADAGGMTMAQDPASAKYASMPQTAVASGVVDHVLQPGRMPVELVAYARHLASIDAASQQGAIEIEIERALDRICELLRRDADQNFKHYKRSTLVRRIRRRIQVLHLPSVDAYLGLLEGSRGEREALFREFLIGVTAFFRDPRAFETLAEEVVPKLLAERGALDHVRVWVPACATGEEAYSLAILFHEALAPLEQKPTVQIFATDIDERAVRFARQGVYPQGIADDVSKERLERHFTKQGGKYRVAKVVRETCLFSVHNLISDPPFSRLDLISCRNLLIYLGLHLQKKLIPVFHYALRPDGYLFLGPSENLSKHTELFRPVNARHRISQRRPTAIASPIEFPARARSDRREGEEPIPEKDLGLIAQRIVLDEFAPAYAIANADLQAIFLSEKAGKYLETPSGPFHGNLLNMTRKGLRSGLRAAFHEAVRTRRRVVHDGVSVDTSAGQQPVTLTVQPMPRLGEDVGLFMVVFDDAGLPKGRVAEGERVARSDAEGVIDQLERELASTRDDLESTVQDLEAANEELKSSNEELVSMNEELQSANEELETSKEEVQAANEALARVNGDLSNLLRSTQIATIFLDRQGRIRDFTPAAAGLYNLIRSDVGRPLAHTTHGFVDLPLLPAFEVVRRADAPIADEVATSDGRWFIRQVLPYRAGDDEIDGVVVTFVDVTKLKAIERDLRESEARFRMMADSAPVKIWLAESEQRFSWFNKRWLAFTGISLEAQAGLGWADRVHPEDRERVLATHASAFAAGEPFSIDFRLRRHDGEWRWLVEHGVPRFESDGSFAGYVGSAIDITERKQASAALRESEARFRNMADSSPMMLWVTEADGRCVWLNRRWSDFTGQTEEEGRGFGWLDAVHVDDRTAARARLLEANAERAPLRNEYRLRRADGEHRWVLDSAAPRFGADGEFLGYIGSVADISERKQAEEERQHLLESERAARTQAGRAAQLKDEFLATISHELRTPLNAILGWVQLLREGMLSVEETRQAVDVIDRNARVQVQLISDLLDTSRIASGRIRLDLASIDPADPIAAAVEAVGPVAADKGVELEIHLGRGLGTIAADPARLEQVVWNLVSNAIKFTPRGGRVTVVLERGASVPDRVTIVVRDTGTGIEAEFLPHLFERFRQADATTTRRHGGLGLGLSIVKQLVELHGGSVRAESEGSGRGASFVVELPLEDPGAALRASDPPLASGVAGAPALRGLDAASRLAGVRILVVDDEPDARDFVRRVLERCEAEVDTAASADEARASFARSAPDVVVSDIGLPGEDGYRLLRSLRELAGERRVVVLALTAFARDEDRERALQAGFDAHLAKPIEPASMIGEIARLVADRARAKPGA